MSAPLFALRVFHPTRDPREITDALGLPPQTSWAAGGGHAETFWQTALAGNETGRSDVESGLRDIAARFAHYRFFVDEIRDGGGRVEVAVGGAAPEAAWIGIFCDLGIALVTTP